MPEDGFFVFLSPQRASSVVWSTDNGAFVYEDDGYPWRESTMHAGIGAGEHVISATVDGEAVVTVRFTMGAGASPATSTTQVGATTTRPVAATTTTTRPVSSTTRPPVSGGVEVRSGESIQGAVNAHPAGTVFVLKAGVHRGQSVVPKDGNVFVGESGAVLDGGGVASAFGGGARDVVVRGLVIEGYAPGFGRAVVGQGGSGWLVEGNEVRNNDGTGIHIGVVGGYVVRDNYVHHNSQMGVSGQGVGSVIEGNEIAYNNTGGYSWTSATAEAGGTKFVMTSGLVVRNNHVHHNAGPGLWTDGSNRGARIEGNLVEDNGGPGIFHEISYAAVITNNRVYRNQYVGIWVSASSDTEVSYNDVRDNTHGGIAANQDPRGDFTVRNLWVHHNTVRLVAPSHSYWGWSGIQQQIGNQSIFTSWNNRFDYNTYIVPAGLDRPFNWMDQRLTFTQWQAYGQDTHSSFQ